jgi:cell fate regulator YaaT (PSP1 superfamily)
MQFNSEIIINNEHNIYPKETESNNDTENNIDENKPCEVIEQIENQSNCTENEAKPSTERQHICNQLENKADQLTPSNTVEICFQNNRKEIYYNPLGWKVKFGDYVLVETENGIDLGKVSSVGIAPYRKFEIHLKPYNPVVHSVKHIASAKEIERYEQNINDQQEVLEIVRDLVKKYNIDMKITNAEWQFDRHRLTIFFLSPQRVDFRELVKELAKIFKTRIELRQITNREHAKRFCSGVGICGLSICCKSFLNEMKTITIEHIKIQQLSTNVSKLTGYCGRLKCCLLFEYDYYLQEAEKYPKIGSVLELEDGIFKFVKFDIFKNTCFFISEDFHKQKTFTLEEIKVFADQHRILEPKEEEQPLQIDENLDDIEFDEYLGFS